jgi:hypothetical protein
MAKTRNRKHKDYTLSLWPDDLSTNTDTLSTPYNCYACGRPCKSVSSLRTHNCQTYRKKAA